MNILCNGFLLHGQQEFCGFVCRPFPFFICALTPSQYANIISRHNTLHHWFRAIILLSKPASSIHRSNPSSILLIDSWIQSIAINVSFFTSWIAMCCFNQYLSNWNYIICVSLWRWLTVTMQCCQYTLVYSPL